MVKINYSRNTDNSEAYLVGYQDESFSATLQTRKLLLSLVGTRKLFIDGFGTPRYTGLGLLLKLLQLGCGLMSCKLYMGGHMRCNLIGFSIFCSEGCFRNLTLECPGYVYANIDSVQFLLPELWECHFCHSKSSNNS